MDAMNNGNGKNVKMALEFKMANTKMEIFEAIILGALKATATKFCI